MFDTPKEAALKAEVARLKAENSYLRRSADMPGVSFGPDHATEEMVMRDIPYKLLLPCLGRVRGQLVAGDRWHVIGFQEHMPTADRFEIGYYAPSWNAPGMNRETFVNHILPRMHEKFIRQLGDILIKS